MPAYPPEVLRETVVNALIHRDYLLTSTDIELAIYSDRLEMISPGRLPNGITPERMRTGCRAARNQLLKDVMRDYGYLEHMGMGVRARSSGNEGAQRDRSRADRRGRELHGSAARRHRQACVNQQQRVYVNHRLLKQFAPQKTAD